MATKKTAQATDVIVTTDTPEGLAERYITFQNAADKATAVKKWEWSRDVSLMLDCTPDKSTRTAHSETLGTIIGNEIKGKPYSGAWVRQHVAAYKKYEHGLDNQEECRAFLSAVNGNAARDSKPAAEKPAVSQTDRETSEDGEVLNDFLGRIVKAVKAALNAEVTADEIRAALVGLI